MGLTYLSFALSLSVSLSRSVCLSVSLSVSLLASLGGIPMNIEKGRRSGQKIRWRPRSNTRSQVYFSSSFVLVKQLK